MAGMRVIDAHELDGTINATVEVGTRTIVVSIPADSNIQAVRAAVIAQVNEQEARERRKVHRKDLLGDL